ncbi:hypothetical protein PpBr36_00548 [Pyricularia pennisetigena]|uniref:hypothetical protein n=1 Tax=Pyricularia pennisetigena TaxID=1578925 RepID=UPI00114F018E|nr:hypothetical protein PpBr36_00548 [Pyricularia pennisetigena]TLS28862.1 hypothetical protein PpBr36_00548 [Pyricularia pennisetigena]
MDQRGIFRAGLQAPKDQRALLDRRDAWAELMRRTPQGLLNIPPDVLDYLKTFHAQKIIPSTPAPGSSHVTWAEPMSKAPRGLLSVPPGILEGLTAFHSSKSAFATATTSSPQASLLSQEPQQTDPIPLSSSPPRETHRPRTAVTPAPLGINHSSPLADDADSPSDTPISGWSLSPPSNDHPRGAAAGVASPSGRTQALRPRTATNSSAQMCSKDSGSGPSSKRMAKSVAQSTTAPMPNPDETESPTRQGITSSSDEADSEDEQMAVEEPLALAPAFHKSVNKTAAPVAPTPPSAQIMPCTDQKNPQQQQQQQQVPKIKRRKMKNAVGLLDKCLGEIPDSDILMQEPLSARSTLFAKRRSGTRTPVPRQSPRDPRSPKALSLSQTPQSVHEPTPHASQHAKITEKLPRVSDNLGTGSGAANPLTRQAGLTPFGIFRTNYPDFKGDLNAFLRACMSLQWLASQNLLKVCLFDDFVRVYCHKYIEFVMSHDSPPSAIEYYNKDDAHPSYLNGVVDASFLKRIQAVYWAEIAAIEAGNPVGESVETSQVRAEQASVDMEIDQPDEDFVADNAEEHTGNHDASTLSSPRQPTQPEESGIFDIDDDLFYRSSRVASPDLSTPVAHSRRNSMPQGDTHTQPNSSAPSTGSILDLTSSSASDVIIPNTSVSMLDTNPSRIPETVHKPRSRRSTESAKRPFRLIAALSNRDSPTSSMSSAQRKRRFGEYLAKSGQRSEA